MAKTKLRLGRTLRTAMKRTHEANRLARLNDANAEKLACSFPVAAGSMRLDNLQHSTIPTLCISVYESGTENAIRLWSPQDIAALRDFLNKHFPPPGC